MLSHSFPEMTHSLLFICCLAAKTCSPIVTLHFCSTHLSPQNDYNEWLVMASWHFFKALAPIPLVYTMQTLCDSHLQEKT